MTPRATMRLQFHKGFAFADAERLVPYLARLGISHVYASPITTARAGSMHGYDVIDPTRVNPELGGEAALKRFVAALRAAGLGLIVDIVPNHMAAVSENVWWLDVLNHGRASRYAPYFDIDWETEDETLRGKVLLPVLGKPLRDALRDGEIALVREADGHVVRYFQQRFPISGTVEDSGTLETVLSRQHYRLAFWRVANDEINWRRFFDINELAGLRMEHTPCFEDVHALVFRLYAEGAIDGVRVDHIDGLADPARYCRTLRSRLDALTGERPAGAPRDRAYILVEKILLRGETLPAAWHCDGTSGYDFMNDASAVQHDERGRASLGALWQSVSSRTADFASEEEAARREIIARSFSAQLDACTASFHRLARAEDAEVSHASLRRALVELLAHFPVYRTYATDKEHPESDARILNTAAAGAMTTCLSTDRAVVDRLHRWLATHGDTVHAALQARAVTRFQQLSAPVAAKAVEDTAFYRYGRLLSRNDVGFDVSRFSDSAADLHANVLRRHADFPHAMLATATHDHKRGEDVRARLAVLSEVADDWAAAVPGWIAQCGPLRATAQPHAGDIAMLLQMIVGAWPLDLAPDDTEGRCAFAQRLAQWQQKALREAKLATDWVVPNEAYESAARDLLIALIETNAAPELLAGLIAFAQRISAAGAVNGLAQTLLKLTVPGVPDIYQGTEFWDFSLVDPDNRRPVDFAGRAAALDAMPLADLAAHWRDGRIKQAVIARTLAFRQEQPALFAAGSYQPVTVRGEHADRVVAFARRLGSKIMVVAVPRIASPLLEVGAIRFAPGAWTDTALGFDADETLVDLFSMKKFRGNAQIAIGELLSRMPISLLIARWS
jgi:(1->4)-alpha-D-glucan 1-alpha-D-glucosylmutase